MDFDKVREAFKPYLWRILLTMGGIAIAVLMLTIGFFPTLLLLVLGMAGFLLGFRFDSLADFKRFLIKLVPERFRRPYE